MRKVDVRVGTTAQDNLPIALLQLTAADESRILVIEISSQPHRY
jgi:hypothetical protein